MDLVIALEERLHDNSLKTDGLLLAFGALASNAKEDVEQEVSQFLLELERNLTPNDEELTTVILAMGNTGSGLVVNTILEYVGHPLEDIQLASIRACLKFTHLPQVLNALKAVYTHG